MNKILALFPLAALFLAGCSGTPTPPGVLTGQMSIGPLTPIQQVGQLEPTPSPELYAAWPIIIYRADGRNEVARLTADAHGSYRIELPPGSYLVDTLHPGIGGAAGLPQQVEIRSGQTTHLDIAVDTGIR